jgi:RHS repeat-associated protein
VNTPSEQDYLARLSGSTWAQTFGYDAFGNISKSGRISWGCLSCYTYSTNRYNTVPNQITYDTNGNLLADSFNTYTWDVYGDLASANGATIIYDAFGRMVENSNGGNQFAYGPTGTNPLASLQGQNLLGAFVPLPGGAVALYNSGGLAQYNHADWLGSARLFSNPSRVAIPAMSYAPFGEGYGGGQGYVQFTSTGNAFTVYDTENQSGSLTDFTFRRYAPVQGRWISPDPAGLAAVDPTNPQSWNRYAYVANNPLSYVDPLGLKYVLICTPVADGGSVCDWYDDGSGDGGTPPPNSGGRSGGGTTKKTVKQVFCSGLPQGRVTSVNGAVGLVGGQQGSAQQVVNYNNGEVSNFVTGGLQAGWNGGASASASIGFVYDTNGQFNNSDFSGPFQNISASAPEGPGGAVSWADNGVKVIQASVGASLIPGPNVNYSYTWTSNPMPGGNIWTTLTGPAGLFDLSVYALRKLGGC